MDPRQKNAVIVIISLFIIAISITVMVGWLFNVPALRGGVLPTLETMKFNVALCFILFSASLLIFQYQTKKYSVLLCLILSLSGTFIGLTTFLQDVFHFNAGIDQLFVFDKTVKSTIFSFPGRMAFNTSLSFTFLGFGLLGLTIKRFSFDIISQYCFHIVTFLAALSLFGYLYGVSFFFSFPFQTPMALSTAILFFILSIAASLINSSFGVIRLFIGNGIGNQMARRFFALFILVVVTLEALEVQSQRLQIFPSLDIERSILTVCFLSISLLLIWNTANWLNKIDAQRLEAEEKIKLMNAGLAEKIEQGSAQFRKSEAKYKSLIEQASDAIYVLDMEGRFTDVNESMCKMMGYTRQELLQLNIEQIIDPEELKVDPLLKSIRDKQQSIFRERTFVTKNGVSFPVEVNVKVFSDDRIMVIARDISNRKKMETELRDAELKFRTIADKSMVGVYIIQNGKYTYVNPRFASIFDYQPHELINNVNVLSIIHESFRGIANENVRRRMEGELDSVHYEAMGLKKGGETNWIELYGSRTMMSGEPTIIGSLIDITERKKAEEELRSSEYKYKFLFENNPMPMWMIAKDDQSIIDANNAAITLYGYSRDEVLQLNVKNIRLPEDHDDQIKGYRKDMDGSNTLRVVRHQKKDGTIIYVNIIAHDIIFEGRPVRLSLTIDVTEKLKAEELLKKSEANLQTILDTTDTAYALFDTELNAQAFNQKAIQFVNEQYGHSPEKGDLLSDYFPKDRFPKFINFTKEILEGKNIHYEIEYPQSDGSLLWFDVRLYPITNDKKEILGILMALYDITERKDTEESLKSAYDRIQNQIISINNMAWKQSHLIRSPLANLKGLISILKEDAPDAEVYNHIRNELTRLDDIIIEMAQDASDADINNPESVYK